MLIVLILSRQVWDSHLIEDVKVNLSEPSAQDRLRIEEFRVVFVTLQNVCDVFFVSLFLHHKSVLECLLSL